MSWITVKGRPYETTWKERAKWKKEVSRKAWHDKWITIWRLKVERNWTDAAIRKYLGKPIKNGDYRVYARADVLKAESLPEFKAWMEKRKERQVAKRGAQS